MLAHSGLLLAFLQLDQEGRRTNVVITERRSESRERVEQYMSVEFVVAEADTIYQFRIWDISSHGMCVLVKSDSSLLRLLKVGLILDMKFHRDDVSKPPDYLKTEIRHITKDISGRFKDHFLVGLSILGGEDSARFVLGPEP